ncbi:MAG: LacI family DNA-binding transcriptional regulator [Cellulosilyticaceae bacterium]
MRKRKQVTLDHIVEKSGLSKVTISKALNNKDGVSEEVKAKVREVADEVGYKFIAQKSSDKSKHIGIVLKQNYISDAGKSTFYLKFYQELAVKLNQGGYICNLFSVTDEEEERGLLPPMFLEVPLNGIISIGNMNKEYVRLLNGLNIPIVYLDCYYNGPEVDCIATDHYNSTYNITQYLIKSGHKELGFVGVRKKPAIQDRLLGYCRALLEEGVPILAENMIPDRDYDNKEIPFELPEKMPTAFVCNGDDLAYKLIEHLKEKGYLVPEDVSVVGFDNDIYAELSTPQITTVAVDRNTMTDKAIEILLAKIKGTQQNSKHQKVVIPGDIIYRESVREIK